MELSGQDIAEEIYQDLQERIAKLKQKNIIPHLVVILVGNNGASLAYVNQKQISGEKIGAQITILKYDSSITTQELEEKITLLNDDPFVHGILIQRPLPEHIEVEKLALLTNPQKDIDGFHPDSPYTLPLPLAVEKILEAIHKKMGTAGYNEWIQSQRIVLLGKGETGGKPILAYLKTQQITPEIIDSKTINADQLIKQADIIISAVGKEVIRPQMLKEGVILIGVGLFKGHDGKLHGDYDEEEIKSIAGYYSPTPKGVGPVNVAMLMDNLVTATERQTR